jgi:hypothetical protein
VYTGFCYEELKAMKNQSIDECLALINILIDGEYDYRIPKIHPLSGSGNQRILILEQGKIHRKIDAAKNISFDGEFIIDRHGDISTTGFINSKVMERL